MVKFLLPFFTLFISIAGAQSTQFGFYAKYDSPVQSTMPKMSDNIGLGFSLGYNPPINLPMYIEIDYNHSNNERETISRSVGFTDGTTKTYNTYYKSNVNNFLIGTKFLSGHEFSAVKFFATPQIGFFNFNTKIDYPNLYEYEENTTDFKRITKKFQRATTFAYGLQLGMEIHISNLIGKEDPKHDNRILLSVNLTQSFSDFKYINLNNTSEYTDASQTLGIDQLVFPNNPTIDNPIYAEKYNTKLSMWGIHIGYIFTLHEKHE